MTDIEKAAKYYELVEIAEDYLSLWKHQKGSGFPLHRWKPARPMLAEGSSGQSAASTFIDRLAQRKKKKPGPASREPGPFLFFSN